MKKVFWIGPIIFTAILLLVDCNKEETPGEIEYKVTNWPVVKTLEATNIDSTTAKLNGTINGHSLSTTVTFEYGTTTSYGSIVTAFQSPVTRDSITHVSAEISGLTPCTIYHFRIKAENSKWINFYGSDSTFISARIPTLTTTSISEITNTTAVSGGDITHNGGAAITERGIYWWSSNMTVDHFYLENDSTGTGSFISKLTGLDSTTTYNVQSSARNCAGIALGNIISFTTLPTVKTLEATNISITGGTLNGNVYANNLTTTVTFEYGTTTIYDSIVTASQSPVTGEGITNISADISGLTPGTIYHFRLKAENSVGTDYGNDITFKTLGLKAPVVTTEFATNLSTPGATLNGSINANGLSTTVTFEYGTSTDYGNTVTAPQSPLSANIVTTVSADITGLTAGTTYHFRVKAENSEGTIYGNDIEFTASSCSQVPAVTTLQAIHLVGGGWELEGIVNPNGLNTTVSFHYKYGKGGGGVAAIQSPVTGDTFTNVSAQLSLYGGYGITCFCTVYAKNACGTVSGNTIHFIP
jgi:hypothetical protein